MRYVDSSGFVFGEVDSLPGCSQVAVSHSVFSVSKLPRAGSKAHAERLAYLRSLGYDYVLCIVNSTNAKQLSILKRFQWKPLDTFTSDKTGHFVCLYGKALYTEDFIATRGSTLLRNNS